MVGILISSHFEHKRRGNSLWVFSLVPFFVDEEAGYPSRARVNVFVGTKDGKIYAPVVQRERHVAYSMRKIPSTDATLKPKTFSTRGNIMRTM